MGEDIKPLIDLFRDFSPKKLVAIADIALVSLLIYKILSLIKGARAWRIIAGIAIFGILLFVSKALQLKTVYWLFDKAALLGPVALVILLLPELRQAIEGFGRLGVWTQWLVSGSEESKVQATAVEEVVSAVTELTATRTGALIILERQSSLDEVAANGVGLDAKVSSALLVSLFYGSNPLHDGAVIVRGDRVIAAACQLPLAQSEGLSPSLHMRHRAAIGVSEAYDCLAIAASEERGTISVAMEGRLVLLPAPSDLRELLTNEWRFGGEPGRPRLLAFSKGRATKG